MCKGFAFYHTYNIEGYYSADEKRDTSQWTWFAHTLLFIIFFDIHILIQATKFIKLIWRSMFIKRVDTTELVSTNVWRD